MKNDCACKVCTEHNEFEARIDALPIEHQEFFRGMHEKMLKLRRKHNAYRDLVLGTHPNADAVIQLKRKKKAREVLDVKWTFPTKATQ